MKYAYTRYLPHWPQNVRIFAAVVQRGEDVAGEIFAGGCVDAAAALTVSVPGIFGAVHAAVAGGLSWKRIRPCDEVESVAGGGGRGERSGVGGLGGGEDVAGDP